MTSIAVNVTSGGNRNLASSWPMGTPQPEATNATIAGATSIPRIGTETVALVTGTSVGSSQFNDGTTVYDASIAAGVVLPANAHVGDAVVVLQVAGAGGFDTWVPVDHYLSTIQNGFSAPGVYQMVSPGVWYRIAS